jgi:diguanylate cyclase (GGDEF)-like protein/PAS domain S-box-containing protein
MQVNAALRSRSSAYLFAFFSGTAIILSFPNIIILSFPNILMNATSSTFLPHGFCFLWNPRLVWLHVIGDAIIWLSYLAIGAALARLAAVERNTKALRVILIAFGIFIVSCGFSHFMDIVVLWKPLYWLQGDLKMVTAISSLATVILLPVALPRLAAVRRAAALSAENESRFLAATDSSQDCFYILRAIRGESGEIEDFRFDFVNANAAALVRQSREKLITQRLCADYPINISGGFFEKYKRVVETGEAMVDEFSISDPLIAATWLRLQVVKFGDGVAITTTDIGPRKQAELDLEASRTFAQSLIDCSPAGMIVFDLDHTIRAINPAAEKMLWYSAAELIGRTTPLIFFDSGELERRARDLTSESGKTVPPNHQVLLAGLEDGIDHVGEWTFLRKGGSRFAAQVTVNPLRGPNRSVNGYLCTFYDVTERKRREEYVSHIAQHDALTQLPTRPLLFDRLEMMLAGCRRYGHRSALLMIDLNRFKQVNDLLGHHMGDDLLVQVAQRMRSTLREVDTIARMGGDEFVVLLPEVRDADDALIVAARLKEQIQAPFTLNGQVTASIDASIGICLYPDSAGDSESMLRSADIAMYHAKQSPGNHVEIFSEEVARTSLRRQEIEAGLRDALRAGELSIHYQPEVELRSGSVIGFEALLRWNNHHLGQVPPSEFIPIAEETGLIIPIGAWVIRKACQDIQRLSEMAGKPALVAVNISPWQLERADLLEVVEEALAENDLDPGYLEIEITESALMGDSPRIIRNLDALRDLGVRVAIDDFGSGFSNMSYLLRFSVDRLKIDQSFIRECSFESNSSTVTTAIIALAHQLKLSVIAEGVETQEQADFLHAAGCDLAQGYFYARPMPLEKNSGENGVMKFCANEASTSRAAPPGFHESE